MNTITVSDQDDDLAADACSRENVRGALHWIKDPTYKILSDDAK